LGGCRDELTFRRVEELSQPQRFSICSHQSDRLGSFPHSQRHCHDLYLLQLPQDHSSVPAYQVLHERPAALSTQSILPHRLIFALPQLHQVTNFVAAQLRHYGRMQLENEILLDVARAHLCRIYVQQPNRNDNFHWLHVLSDESQKFRGFDRSFAWLSANLRDAARRRVL
jgi:hypothetical protein